VNPEPVLHFAVSQTTTKLDKSIRNSGLAMIDMGDDGKITYVV